MATQTVVDRPFRDLDVPEDLDTRGETVGPVGVVDTPVESVEIDDRLSPARGILLALLLCTPFWIAVYWLLF